METEKIVMGCINALIAITLFIYVSFTARCKGPILLSSYSWISKKERKKANKKAEYKIVTIVYGFISAIFSLSALNVFMRWKWISILIWILLIFVIIYDIVATIKIVIKN